MALPTLVKTWQFNVNNSLSVQSTNQADMKAAVLAIKNLLIGFGTAPWTVRYSCDGTTAGTAGDGVDRWSTVANIVNAAPGTAHSWMVLRQTGVGANFEICIDLSQAGNTNGYTMVLSFGAAFTGGSTTARPTATDEKALFTNSPLGGGLVAKRLHAMQSTDGACTRVIVTTAGACAGMLIIDAAANAISGWTVPVVAYAIGASPAASSANWSTVAGNFNVRVGSTNGAACLACEGVATGVIPEVGPGSVANETDLAWPVLPLAIWGVTVGQRGRLGTMIDMFAGSVNVPTGDSYPNNTTYLFAQFNTLILPWNGAAPLLS